MSEADVLVVYADGLLDAINLGANMAFTYFAYERTNSGSIERCPVLRVILPKKAIAAARELVDGAQEQPDPSTVFDGLPLAAS